MARADLIENVRALMVQAGFTVSDRCDLRPVSFDLVARRNKEIVIKVRTNVDALSEPIASEVKLLCNDRTKPPSDASTPNAVRRRAGESSA